LYISHVSPDDGLSEPKHVSEKIMYLNNKNNYLCDEIKLSYFLFIFITVFFVIYLHTDINLFPSIDIERENQKG
jgi:hypothetical protein